MQIFNMSETSARNIRLVAFKLWKELIILTCDPVFARTRKIYVENKCVFPSLQKGNCMSVTNRYSLYSNKYGLKNDLDLINW